MYHLLEGFNESFAKGGLMLFLFNFAIFSKKISNTSGIMARTYII